MLSLQIAFFALAFWFTVAAASRGHPPHSPPLSNLIVSTTSGTVHGKIDEAYPNVRQFLGIPFVQPPLASLRWLPPRSIPSSTTNRDIYATSLPPSCPQILNPISPSIYVRDVLQFNLQGLNVTGATSEDCLTLSIWAPYIKAKGWSRGKHEPLPVLIFIYGGGFATGGINVPYQIPTQWVERTTDHIVVSFNYRVNIFGFPNAAGLNEQNLGLLDQRAAVYWVQENIANFGGDASRITLWGQSAGSASVDFYTFAYHQDPIVAGLIMDSGTALTPTAIIDAQHTNFTFVASQLGCGGLETQPANQLDCMRALNATTIEAFLYDYAVSGASPALGFDPIIDEKIVFSNYTERALDGLQAKIPAIIGTNSQDGVPFAPYTAAGVNQTVALFQLLTTFFCPATQTILDRQRANLSTFRYFYAGNWSNIAPRPWEAAYHSSELPMLMGTYDNYRGQGPDLETQTSTAMQDAYLAFARDGVQGIQGTGWIEYSRLGEGVAREFGAGVPVQDTDLGSLEHLCSQGKPTYSL